MAMQIGLAMIWNIAFLHAMGLQCSTLGSTYCLYCTYFFHHPAWSRQNMDFSPKSSTQNCFLKIPYSIHFRMIVYIYICIYILYILIYGPDICGKASPADIGNCHHFPGLGGSKLTAESESEWLRQCAVAKFWIYAPVNCYIPMENHHRQQVNQL